MGYFIKCDPMATIQKREKPITMTVDPKTVDDMSVIDLLQRAKLRGLVIFGNNRLARGRGLRTRIIEHDNALSHLNSARKAEFARLGAMEPSEIRDLCNRTGISTRPNKKIQSQLCAANCAFLLGYSLPNLMMMHSTFRIRKTRQNYAGSP